METLFQDLRFGVRLLLRNRGLTLIALVALTLGIGANSAIFSVVNAVLLKPLSYPDADRLMRVSEKSPQFDAMSVSYMNYADWRDKNSSFEKMAIYQNVGYNLSTPEGADRVFGRRVSANFFSILGISPAIGRDFQPEEDRAGASPAVIVSHGLWQRRFGADPNLVGKTIILNDISYTVAGILPASFRFYSPAEVFTPYALQDDMTMHTRELRSGNRVI